MKASTMDHDDQVAGTLQATEHVDTVVRHDDAKRLFDACPALRRVPVVGSAVEAFGPKCVSALGVVYVLDKGIAKSILSYSLYPMFMKQYNVTPAVYQRMSGISKMGFAIKPITAIFSDAVALFGYSKRWYMLLSCIAGAVCTIAYATLPAAQSSAPIAAGLIFVSMYCIANVDVLSEGHYSRLIKRLPLPGANLISWIWAVIMVGSIVASAIQGPLSDAGNPRVGIFISAALQAVCSLLFVVNWYGEQPNRTARLRDHVQLLAIAKDTQTPLSDDMSPSCDKRGNALHEQYAYPADNDGLTLPTTTVVVGGNEATEYVAVVSDAAPSACCSANKDNAMCCEQNLLELRTCCCGAIEVNTEVLQRNIVMVVYAVIMTASVIIIAIMNIIGSTYQLLYSTVVLSFALTALGFVCLPLTIMKANFFGWLQLVLYISLPGGLDNFYMADASCVPGGPQFSQAFYNAVGAIIGNCAGLVGVYLFAKIFSQHSLRLTFVITIFVQVVASVFDLVMVKRWNIAIGIPDHAMYIMGDAVIYQVSYMLSYMPMNMLISRLCPPGCESTVFALLASFSNLGASTSDTIGAILLETVWPIDTNIKPCDFSNLPWLLITGHMITPLLCLPFVFCLVPGTRVCDDVDPRILNQVPYGVQWMTKLKHWWHDRRARDAASSTTDISTQAQVHEPI